MLSHWGEELGKHMMMRQNNMAARVHGVHGHHDINPSQQTAMQIAQAAAAHAANQKVGQYNHRYVRIIIIRVRKYR